MDQVEEIKSKVDVVELIQEYVKLARAGRNFKGLCPFHGEKTPSFMVNPELQIFKCFGCGEGGDAYSFLQKIEGMDFGEALQYLAKRTGVKLESYKPTQGEELREKLIKINSLAAEVYHWLLTKHKSGGKALEYVKERGLSEEAVEKFKIGYAPESWDFMIKFLMGKKGYKMEDLNRAGLVVKNYDRFRDRVMFPLNNARGQTVGFAGRILAQGDQGTQGAKYINTAETEIYHKSELLYGLDVTRSEIKAKGFAVVVEGEIDAIASWQANVKNVVAIKGSALTEKQVELLRRICDTVVLALDTDLAGDAAARRGIEMADKAGMSIKVAKLKGVKDPGELAIEDPKEWKRVVEEAIPIYDFYIESAVERYGLEVGGKKKIGGEVVPVLAKIEDEIVRAHYMKKLAKVLGVEEEDIRRQLGKITNHKSQIINNDQMADDKMKKSRREVVEEYIVMLAVRMKKTDQLPEMKTEFWMKVAEALKKNPEVKKLPAELREKVEELFFGPEADEEEWEKALKGLEEIDVRQEMVGGEGDMRELTKRLAKLTKE